MNRKYFKGIAAAIGMLILILDGKTAVMGAQTGVMLCMQTVIPSLFPFFLLSILLTSYFMGGSLSLLRPLARFCGIPHGAESILVSSFLGGYPVGAQSVTEAFKSGYFSRKDAEKMLSFCNNAGPAFLFGMVAAIFPGRRFAWSLWSIQLVSALLVSKIIHPINPNPVQFARQSPKTLSSALTSAIGIMTAVCGWVIVFRIIIAFVDKWFFWIFASEIRIALTGFLELSNGCCELSQIENTELRFILCSAMLSWGGLCVTMQTISVCQGLSLRFYFWGKLLQTLLSIFLSISVATKNPYPLIVILVILIVGKMKNKDSIPSPIVV